MYVQLRKVLVLPRNLKRYAESEITRQSRSIPFSSKGRASAESGEKVNLSPLALKVITGRIGEVYHLSPTFDFEESCTVNEDVDNIEKVETSVFVELEVEGARGMSRACPLDGVYEMRKYELQLGYSTVPKFHELYANGLIDKLQTDQTKQSQLISLMYSEAGAAQLNTVIELWHHTSFQGSQESRKASRSASKWRQAIADIATLALRFETQLLSPIVFTSES